MVKYFNQPNLTYGYFDTVYIIPTESIWIPIRALQVNILYVYLRT